VSFTFRSEMFRRLRQISDEFTDVVRSLDTPKLSNVIWTLLNITCVMSQLVKPNIESLYL